MSDNNSSGWAPAGVAWVVVVCLFALVACGAPVLNRDGLSWDNSAILAREQARHGEEMARIDAQDAASERGAANLALLIQVVGGCLAIIVGIVGAMSIAALGFGAWENAAIHRDDNLTRVQLAALPLLASRPGAHVEQIEGTWWVVDDAAAELIPVSHRLS
jgi:hypothetical protein